MIVAGLDQSPRGIGFAVGSPGSVPLRGYRENPDFGDNTARLGIDVYRWAQGFIREHRVERIYYEQILLRKHGSFDAHVFHKQARVVGGIELAAAEAGLADDAYEVLVADWRREFHHGMQPQRDKGDLSAAWKALALKECAARNWWTEDHNVAEACGIWAFGCLCEDPIHRARSRLAKRRAQHEQDEERRAAL